MVKQIEALIKKRDVLNNRIKLVQNREAKQKQKDDTKRKILIGTYYLEQAIKNNNFDELVKQLDTSLKRDSDRKLFNLPILQKK
jgi:hypothetical protein